MFGAVFECNDCDSDIYAGDGVIGLRQAVHKEHDQIQTTEVLGQLKRICPRDSSKLKKITQKK